MLKEIPELLEHQVISPEVAERIKAYYLTKKSRSQNKLFVIFGVLGALLVGLGIILIIAHNWDDMSRTLKTILSFLPLIIGQALAIRVILGKRDSMAWREGTATFLFFAVGACISLVSQVYNIPGDLASYLFTWMLLCLPLAYLLNSSMTSLLYIAGISWYACELGYWKYDAQEPFWYWILLAMIIPYYLYLLKKKPDSNVVSFHHWFIALSLIVCLGVVADNHEQLIFIAYMSLFSIFYLVGNLEIFNKGRMLSNGFRLLGSLGIIFLLILLSFEWFWEDLYNDDFWYKGLLKSPEWYASVILSLVALYLLYYKNRFQVLYFNNLFELTFLLFILIFLHGLSFPLLAVVMVNLLVFLIGVETIRKGARQDHLGIINFGLLIITAQIACRFFDTDISFVLRGLLFVSVGIGFFYTNYLMIKKRKEHEN